MKVAKIRFWDGRVFYTDRVEREFVASLFDRARTEVKEQTVPAQVDIIEMTPEEYQAIPATNEAARLFGTIAPESP